MESLALKETKGNLQKRDNWAGGIAQSESVVKGKKEL
jgi:hypothetical protein